MSRHVVLSVVSAALFLGAGCEGSVNDDANFFVLTFRASLDPAGVELSGPSDRARITPDGRYVAFQSRANNLVAGDVNTKIDIFRKDVTTGAVLRVSVEAFDDGDPVDGLPFITTPPIDITSSNHNPNEDCTNPQITPDGRYVVFQSKAGDLADDDPSANNVLSFDIFRRDLVTGETLWISIPATPGVTPDGDSINPTISDDGRYVAFESAASNMVLTDSMGGTDIFVRDTLFNTTALVSANSTGVQANNFSNNAAISGDGNQVAFESLATNLVAGDDGSFRDIFVKSWLAPTPAVTRASVEAAGEPDGDLSDGDNADAPSTLPSISQNGRFVTFVSGAPDLVPGDNNGVADIFVRDTAGGGKTTRVSVSSRGGEASQPSGSPQISRDGRWVTFHSLTPDLIPSDTNNAVDIFLRDTVTNTTIRISVATYGIESSPFFDSSTPSISSDGRFVAFTSFAPNLAPNDTNGTSDIYIRGPLY